VRVDNGPDRLRPFATGDMMAFVIRIQMKRGDDQYIFSSSWHAWLKVRNGSGNPLLIDCLIPENVVFSLA
jgi:hypothetical protein